MLLATLSGAIVSSPAAGEETADSAVVRLVARNLPNGKVEFGLQERNSDASWGDRQLPRVRLFPTTARVGRWLASSSLALAVGEVRIVARKLADGRVEFGLQQRQGDNSWSTTLLTQRRFFPTDARINRWLASSPLTVTASRPAGGYTAVDAGGSHTCALRSDSTVTCWGDNEEGQTDAPSGTFTTIDVGWNHSCGLRTDDTVACWGYNSAGQADAPSGTFTAVSVNGTHSCGIRSDSTIDCWGEPSNGGPAPPPGGRFTAISAGWDYSCAIDTAGAIACWGFSWYSQLRPPEGTFTTLDVHSPACALRTDGTLACWGIWEHPWDHSPRPDGTFIAVDIDTKHGCAIRTDGTVACWGTPGGVSEPPPGTFTAITSGDYYSCGLRTYNTIACWGSNRDGQTDAPSGTFTAITSGRDHSCGLRTNSAITCWGTNDHGQAPRSA